MTLRAVSFVPAAVGDVLDCEARFRIRSLYFPFGSVPMFPRCLAEGAFSLGADASSSSSSSAAGAESAVSDALSVCITLSDDGSLGDIVKLCPSRVRVSHQLTYDVVDADLGLGPGLCQYEDLQLIYEAARLR
jgi:exoribonuclease-2